MVKLVEKVLLTSFKQVKRSFSHGVPSLTMICQLVLSKQQFPETMSDVLKDSDYLQHTYCISQTNRSEGSDLISHVFDSVMEYVVEVCWHCENFHHSFSYMLF